ncbi:hypothetical protein [Cryobacterium sp. TMB1-7]|uniref:hypothetical protein n=1 Tax=Cryobacterium sp. TMB1-7 TaxID=2555866 RepID=UPI00106D4261|nr:hypothetical protein [Cryobacterium sp. TMB1-7]TFC60040.1 hypothetical protein E3O60_08170 [Cryobacterium sp. TMB1-7]
MARGELFPVVNCVDLATTWRWYVSVLSGVVDYRFPERGEPDVPDLAAVVEAAAAAVVVPPADMPWGERVAYLRDPEGTMLLVIRDADSNESGPS